MKLGIAMLVAAYGLSQFYRAFLAVLTPALARDVGATADDLATASGVLFLVFAAMQIPVGAMLDRIGPRFTVAVIFAIGGAGGATAFSFAQTPAHITIAMGLIGMGSAPVLMAAYYIFAKTYSPAIFATLAGAIIGLGSLGNLAGSAPMAWAVEALGWRETMRVLAVVTLAVCALLWIFVQDPPKAKTPQKGSVLDVLKIPALWPIFALMLVAYAPSAGLRGLWAGPYGESVFGLDAAGIGQMTLIMGLAMIAGSFTYGPMDRVFGTRKGVIFVGNAIGLCGLIGLWAFPASGVWTATILLAVVGTAGASFPMIVAHGKAFLPDHLTGRGVTLLNLFGIGGVGIMQMATGRVYDAFSPAGPASAFAAIFASFAVLLLIGLVIFAFSTDRTD